MKFNDISKDLIKGSIFLLSCSLVIAQPAATQQSLNVLSAEEQIQPVKNKPRTVIRIKKIKKEKKVYYKAYKDIVYDYSVKYVSNYHPYLSFTPKSVYTPVGTPIQWGGRACRERISWISHPT